MEPIEATDLIQLLSMEQWKHSFQGGEKLPPELEELGRVVREHPEILENRQKEIPPLETIVSSLQLDGSPNPPSSP